MCRILTILCGFAHLLKPAGIATFEFPHLLRLVSENQFDTIYHEHYSYLSLTAVKRIFERGGLNMFDVEELSTHGGSLRVLCATCRVWHSCNKHEVQICCNGKLQAGMVAPTFYANFQTKA